LRLRHVDVVGARKQASAAKKAKAILVDLKHAIAKDIAVALGLRLKQLADQVGAAHPAIALHLKGSSHFIQLVNRLLLKLSDIEMRARGFAFRTLRTRWSWRMVLALRVAPHTLLDAIMIPDVMRGPEAPDEVWITWCDQVAIHPATIERLAELTGRHRDAAVVMPTVRRSAPYIHLQRDGANRITGILHRREGDSMPDVGESDMGLFALPSASFANLLPRYAEEVTRGATTGERRRGPVVVDPYLLAF
jgi:hypothetical protein